MLCQTAAHATYLVKGRGYGDFTILHLTDHFVFKFHTRHIIIIILCLKIERRVNLVFVFLFLLFFAPLKNEVSKASATHYAKNSEKWKSLLRTL